MENRRLPTDRRSANLPLRERVEGLAREILEHIASNPVPSSTPARGRNSSRGRAARGGRSVSFANNCACPGPNCTSRANPPAYSELNPQASSFTPAARERSRNTARRSRPQRTASSNLCRPRLGEHSHRSGFRETGAVDTGANSPLWPPSAFVTSGEEDQASVKRSGDSSPFLGSSPPISPPESPGPLPLARRTPPPSPPATPRASSPVLEPDTSAISCTRPIDLGFRVNINHRFEHSTVGVEKKYEYSCSCSESKSHCICPEAILEVFLKVRYQLRDPLLPGSTPESSES